MSERRIQLADSDDPSEILGVSEQPTMDEIYAARQRLLRSFPPSRAPHEYQRIQGAFEYWRDVLSLPEFREAPKLHGSASVARAATAQVLPEPEPDLAEPHVAEFSSRQRGGATTLELTEWWLSGLRDGLELVESIFFYSPREVLQQLALSEDLAWPTLGQRGIRWRGRLWQLYAEAQLEQGNWAVLFDQLRDRGFRLAAKSDPTLRVAAWQVLGVAAWEMPEQAFVDVAWLGTLDPQSAGARAFLDVRAVRGQFQRWCVSPTVPASFGPLVRLGRVNESARLRSLREIGNAWPQEADTWWQLCAQLARHAPALTSYVLEILRLDAWSREPAPHLLSPAQQLSLENVLQTAKRQGSLAISLLTLLVSLLSVSLLAWLAFAALAAVGREPRDPAWLSRWILAVGVAAFGATVAVENSRKDRAPLLYLRRELQRLGFGYQQLVAARLWVRDPVPKDLGQHPGLELYLTLGLASANACAQPSNGEAATHERAHR